MVQATCAQLREAGSTSPTLGALLSYLASKEPGTVGPFDDPVAAVVALLAATSPDTVNGPRVRIVYNVPSFAPTTRSVAGIDVAGID